MQFTSNIKNKGDTDIFLRNKVLFNGVNTSTNVLDKNNLNYGVAHYFS
jgi:hypothetical protein